MAREMTEFQRDRCLTQIELHEEFEKLSKGMDEANRNFINQMARETVKIARHRVGVKTGKTKKSIEVKHKAKYTRVDVGVDSWLIPWVEGGGQYHENNDWGKTFEGNGRSYRKWYHNNKWTRRKKITKKRMHKSHPAYYLLRPAKQLMGSVKSLKVYDRNVNKILKELIRDGEV